MQIQLYYINNNILVGPYMFYDPISTYCWAVPFISEHVITSSIQAIERRAVNYFNPTRDGTLLLTFQSNEVSLLEAMYPELFI